MASAGIAITLDRPRTLKLTYEQLIALEQRIGKPSGEIFGDLAKMSLQSLTAVMFAALRHEDTKLRYDAVGRMIGEYLEDGHDIGDLLQLVNEVVTQSGLFGRVEEKEPTATS